MSFAQPAAWMWAALAVPIVLLYVLKIRMRRVPVSTTMFWDQVFEDRRPRAWWQRLRHLMSLLLQLAFLLLLVSALADPLLEWGQLEPRRTVLIVDSSASMQAGDVPGGRFQEAVQKAGRLIDDLRDRDSMALIAAGTQPRVLCGTTGHHRSLRQALEGLQVSDGPTCVAQAVQLARRILAGDSAARIVVLSDGGFPGAAELATAEDVSFLRVGAAADNVALTRFQVRRSLVDPIGYQTLVEVQNLGRSAVECSFELSLAGALLDVLPLKLAAGEVWTRVFEQTSAEGGLLEGRLEVEDALALDDRAVAVLPERRPIRVAAGGEPNLFLRSVLEANPLVQAQWVDAPGGASGSEGSPEGERPSGDLPPRPAADGHVFHQQVPSPLPAGPVLIIDPLNSSELWEVGEAIPTPLITQQDSESALMRYVELQNVFIPEARALRALGPAKVLAASLSEDPVYLRFERPGGPVLVLAIPLTQTDLPLRTAFPILISNALNEFTGTKGELRESLSTAETTELALRELGLARGLGAAGGAGAAGSELARVGLGREVVLEAPDGQQQRLRARGDSLDVGPLDRCGVWTARLEEDGAGVPLAVNLADAAESDLRVDDSLDSAPMPSTAGFGGQPLWWYLVAAALLLSTLEWGLYHRRRVE